MQEATTQEPIIYAAPKINGSVNWKKRINVSDVHKYWDQVIGKELRENETVRITAVKPYIGSDGGKNGGQITVTEPVRTKEELVEYIQKHYNECDNRFKDEVGFSMGAAVFLQSVSDDGKRLAPNKAQFVSTRTLVFDLDSHETKSASSPRYNFNALNDDTIRLTGALTVNNINYYLTESKLGFKIKAKAVYATGGGIQVIIGFDKDLNMEQAQKIFNYFKGSLRKLSETLFNVIGFNTISPELQKCYIEYDASSADITHTQRLGGTVNPKESYDSSFAYEIEDMYNFDLLDNAMDNMTNQILDLPYDVKKKEGRAKAIELMQNMVRTFKEDSEDETTKDLLLVDGLMLDSIYKQHATSAIKKSNEHLMTTPGDGNILKQIDFNAQIAYMEEHYLTKSKNNQGSSYTRYKCPIHTDVVDEHGSFAIYNNNTNGVAAGWDYHGEGTAYNLIQLIMAVKNCTRTAAISELQAAFAIDLKTTDRKDIHKDDIQSELDVLIDKIDRENYVYYRLANKQRACVVRAFESGSSHTFDGSKMMSDHILANQLGMHEADIEKRAIFHDLFVQKILINAFEEFAPGESYIYKREFMKYVNLWIPGSDYIRIHELAETMDEYDLTTSINLIKERLPHSWFFINQMTQKGSLEYFINWMASCAAFETLATIPIVTAVQGSGKGIFVNHMMGFYLNIKYINTINSEKMKNNFNSFMEQSSLICLDEGDFSKTHDVDQLKLLSGNDWVQVEKKGIDSVQVKRHFNFIMTTNGETPMKHPSNDRRITYFRCDVPLVDSVKQYGYDDINDFMDDMKDELTEFWAILVKTKRKREWVHMNLKDNQFNKQVLLQHPFGKLVIKIIEGDWTDIKFQLSANITDHVMIQANNDMMTEMHDTYTMSQEIDLTLINKYISSMNYKDYKSVLDFIKYNKLELNGIRIKDNGSSMKIVLDVDKIKNLIYMKNNLGDLFDCYNDANINNTLNYLNEDEMVIKEQIVAANAAITEPIGLMPHPADPLGITKPPKPGSIMQ